MEFIFVLIVFVFAVLFMFRHMMRTFKQGEMCKNCGKKNSACGKMPG